MHLKLMLKHEDRRIIIACKNRKQLHQHYSYQLHTLYLENLKAGVIAESVSYFREVFKIKRLWFLMDHNLMLVYSTEVK